jgi:hypothetical protein
MTGRRSHPAALLSHDSRATGAMTGPQEPVRATGASEARGASQARPEARPAESAESAERDSASSRLGHIPARHVQPAAHNRQPPRRVAKGGGGGGGGGRGGGGRAEHRKIGSDRTKGCKKAQKTRPVRGEESEAQKTRPIKGRRARRSRKRGAADYVLRPAWRRLVVVGGRGSEAGDALRDDDRIRGGEGLPAGGLVVEGARMPVGIPGGETDMSKHVVHSWMGWNQKIFLRDGGIFLSESKTVLQA